GPAQDLLQQCLRAAGITEQLLEAEAKRDPGSSQPPVAPRSAQPLVQHLGPCSCLPLAVGPAQPGGQQVVATALPVPQLMFLQQVPQRIILQVKQPGPTTLTLLPSPALCVLGGPQSHWPPPSCHPVTLWPPCSSSSPAQQRPHARACGTRAVPQ
ncbi:hypothetical protein Nmel_017377, partial [Mimus melanotis]